MRRRAQLLALVLLVSTGAACRSTGARPWPTTLAAPPPALVETSAAPPVPQGGSRAFVPAGRGASHYEAPLASGETESARREIVEQVGRLARRLGRPVPAPGAVYRRAADDFARAADLRENPPLALIAFVQAHQGVVEPVPGIAFMTAPVGGEGRALGELEAQVGQLLAQAPWSRIGVGIDRRGSTSVVALALWEQTVELEAVPRTVPRAGRVIVAGRLLGAHREPEVIVTRPNGTGQTLRPSIKGPRFRAEVSCAEVGRLQIEVVGTDVGGPKVLANFPVFCGVAPPSQMAVEAERPERFANTAEAERALHALVNRSRAEAGLPALALDERLTQVARGHSAEMARLETVAHVLPATGDAADRVKAAGLRPRFIAENVGMAHSVAGVHEGLLGSPGHRANILHKEPTRVGIGVVPKLVDDGRAILIYVTELFAAGLE